MRLSVALMPLIPAGGCLFLSIQPPTASVEENKTLLVQVVQDCAFGGNKNYTGLFDPAHSDKIIVCPSRLRDRAHLRYVIEHEKMHIHFFLNRQEKVDYRNEYLIDIAATNSLLQKGDCEAIGSYALFDPKQQEPAYQPGIYYAWKLS